MSLKDTVNQNLQNAAQNATKEQETALRETVDEVCNAIREYIIFCSNRHTNSQSPFRVDLCLVCDRSCLETKEGSYVKGFFQQSTRIDTITMKTQVLRQIGMMQERLQKEGVRMGALRYSADYRLDDDLNIIPANRRVGPFQVYSVQQNRVKGAEVLLNPAQPITVKVTEDKGFGTRYTRTYSQGNLQYSDRDMKEQIICMHLSFAL